MIRLLKVAVKRTKVGILAKLHCQFHLHLQHQRVYFVNMIIRFVVVFLFKCKPVAVRRKFVSDHSLCFIYLKSGHSVDSKALVLLACKKCEGRHNTLLPLEDVGTKNNSEVTQKENSDVQASTSKLIENNIMFAGKISTRAIVVLGTAVIWIQDDTGVTHQVRILLDSGLQVSAITADYVTRLGLKRNN